MPLKPREIEMLNLLVKYVERADFDEAKLVIKRLKIPAGADDELKNLLGQFYLAIEEINVSSAAESALKIATRMKLSAPGYNWQFDQRQTLTTFKTAVQAMIERIDDNEYSTALGMFQSQALQPAGSSAEETKAVKGLLSFLKAALTSNNNIQADQLANTLADKLGLRRMRRAA